MNEDAAKMWVQGAAMVMLGSLKGPTCDAGNCGCVMLATVTRYNPAWGTEYRCDLHAEQFRVEGDDGRTAGGCGPITQLPAAPVIRRLVRLAFPGGLT